jgi:hypothetical protein
MQFRVDNHLQLADYVSAPFQKDPRTYYYQLASSIYVSLEGLPLLDTLHR